MPSWVRTAAEQGGATFSADTGIEMSTFAERAVLTFSTGDIEPLLSSELTSDSQLLYRRDMVERLSALAPLATFGADPYPVITASVWFGSSTATRRPRPTPTPSSSRSAGVRVNYAHPSLKATVDAYDGTVHLYRTSRRRRRPDPRGVGPDLPRPRRADRRQCPTTGAHLLYPPDLLAVQSSLLGRYHVDDVEIALQRHAALVTLGRTAPSGVATGSTDRRTRVTVFQPTGRSPAGHLRRLPYNPGAERRELGPRPARRPRPRRPRRLRELSTGHHRSRPGREVGDAARSPRARSTPIHASPNSSPCSTPTDPSCSSDR